MMSEHSGVKLKIDLKANLRQKQFFIKRNSRNFTWVNIEKDVYENNNLQSLFNDSDPDIISEKLLRGLNTIIKKHIDIKRVQIKNNTVPYWNQTLQNSSI